MKQLSLLLTLIISNVLFSQTDSLKTDIKPINSEYFHRETQEKFFIHTNKTTYFTGEKIWWKAYVVNDLDESLLRIIPKCCVYAKIVVNLKRKNSTYFTPLN